jgi:Lrp/AsnC family transcriptional regulator for asnA, asnC and gidA
MSPASSRTALDDVSRAIIAQLQQDGRRAYATIGKAVGLSEAAVRQRVQKLIESGAMQIVAVTDPTQVGFARQAMIAITVTGDIEAVAAKLAAIAEVEYLVVIAGSYDLLAEVVVHDDEHLLDLLNNRIRSIPGVQRTETSTYLKLVKQTYNWGAS